MEINHGVRTDRGEKEILSWMAGIQDVTGVWLADLSGEVQIALPAGQESELQGAMAGALAGAVKQAVQHLAIGSVNQIIVEAAGGTLLVASGPSDVTMIVRARDSVNLGLLRLEVRKAGKRLAQVQSADAAVG